MDLITRIKGKVSAIQRAMASAAAGVEEIRQAIADLRAERQAVEGAPVPANEAAALLDRMLDGWIIAGQNSGVTVDGLVSAALAGHTPQIELHRPPTLGTVLTLLTPLLRSYLRAGLLSELERRYADTPAGLPADARQLRLAEIDQELSRLETLGEEAIQAAEEGGLQIPRRPDAAVEAILGITP